MFFFSSLEKPKPFVVSPSLLLCSSSCCLLLAFFIAFSSLLQQPFKVAGRLMAVINFDYTELRKHNQRGGGGETWDKARQDEARRGGKAKCVPTHAEKDLLSC